MKLLTAITSMPSMPNSDMALRAKASMGPAVMMVSLSPALIMSAWPGVKV